MRALQPTASGDVVRGGVSLHWESFGDGDETVLLLPTWSIIPSRHWKFQVPYLARRFRVLTFDGRGSGRSDRPAGAAAYTHHQFASDALSVLDATETDEAALVALSCGTLWAIQVAADHPDRVRGLAAVGPALPLTPGLPERSVHPVDEPIDETAGWAKYNHHHWRRDYRDFLDFFAGRMFTEPHSTKQIEDFVGWGLDIDPATLIDTDLGIDACGTESFRSVCERVGCPVFVMHGDEDAIRPHAAAVALADLTGGSLLTIVGGGHAPMLRDPVKVNVELDRFLRSLSPSAGAGALSSSAADSRAAT